ncbi:hypothetical protein [Sphingobium terrigena]|uniref:hypothetical protein n=1 Tax=Sphingobium terrigena TaxID=2304063 RepID=UPI001EEFEF0E|nr:hypothetical protein [Sphingobium terrigena]
MADAHVPIVAMQHQICTIDVQFIVDADQHDTAVRVLRRALERAGRGRMAIGSGRIGWTGHCTIFYGHFFNCLAAFMRSAGHYALLNCEIMLQRSEGPCVAKGRAYTSHKSRP